MYLVGRLDVQYAKGFLGSLFLISVNNLKTKPLENNYNNSNNNNGGVPTAGSPTVIVAGTQPETKKTSVWWWIGGGALALVLFNKLSTSNTTDLSEDQKDILLEAGAGDPGELTLQPKDATPIVFTTGDSSMDIDKLTSIIDGHYAKYAATCEKISAKLQSDAATVFATVAILFGELPEGKVITEKSLDGYFKVLDIWSARFDSAMGIVSNAINNILIAQIAGLDKANKCTKWVYIRSEEITQTESTSKTAVVKNISKANNGFLGIAGKTKTSTSETLNSSLVTQTHNDKISFVPHCEKFQLDPVVVMSVLNSSSTSVALQYDLLSGVCAMAPKPENFLTNVPGNV
jgi:hypothetical protein